MVLNLNDPANLFGFGWKLWLILRKNFPDSKRLFKFLLNPLRGSQAYWLFASGFTGGYSNSSPSDFWFFLTLKGCYFNNRGLRRELSRTVLTRGK